MNLYKRDQEEFIHASLAKIPEVFRAFALGCYKDTAHRSSDIFANQALYKATKKVPKISPKSDLDEIRLIASQCVNYVNGCRGDDRQVFNSIFRFNESGVELPDINRYGFDGAVARLRSTDWWEAQLYKVHLRLIEQTAIVVGKVHRKSNKYISDESLQLFRLRKDRNKKLLENMRVVNTDTGETFDLSEAVESSVANPTIRRYEMMTRLAGMDEFSVVQEREAMFYTITAPSRQHARHSGSGKENSKFCGDMPRATHKELGEKWAKARAALARNNIEYSGIRVVEPHHDGTPHWHMLVFIDKYDIPDFTHVIKRYFLYSDCPDDRGAKDRRVTVERIDRKRGSAVGYVAKYISKNIDGYGMDASDASDSERAVAWSSVWGIRQFQFFGGPPVTVWRELRKLDADEGSEFCEVAELAKNADWLGFMMYEQDNSLSTVYETEEGSGAYGEDVRRLKGMSLNDEYLETRNGNYVIEFISGHSSSGEAVCVASQDDIEKLMQISER